MICRYLLILMSVFLMITESFAESSAENIAGQYGDAVANEDWQKAASYFSSPDLKKIRNGFESLLNSRSFQLSFFPGKEAEDIEKLSDVEFVSNIFGYFFKTMRSRGISIEMSPPKVLGSVKEGKKSSHVVYRQKGIINGSEVSIVDITTVQKINDNWHVVIPEEFDGFIASVKERLTRVSN